MSFQPIMASSARILHHNTLSHNMGPRKNAIEQTNYLLHVLLFIFSNIFSFLVMETSLSAVIYDWITGSLALRNICV